MTTDCEMTKATEDQVRAHYESQGSEVQIAKDGRVIFRRVGGKWLGGRWVSEYRVDDRGNVHLT